MYSSKSLTIFYTSGIQAVATFVCVLTENQLKEKERDCFCCCCSILNTQHSKSCWTSAAKFFLWQEMEHDVTSDFVKDKTVIYLSTRSSKRLEVWSFFQIMSSCLHFHLFFFFCPNCNYLLIYSNFKFIGSSNT